MAFEDAEELNSNWWMDIYAWGEYPIAGLKFLKEKGWAPTIKEGDIELLKSGKPDFMGVNYYKSTTYEKNPLDGVGIGTFNTTGKKGTTQDEGVPGAYKTIKNDYLEATNWDWEIDPTGLRIGLRRITSRYRLPVLISENGLGEFDKLEENNVINDDYRIDYLKQHITACQEAITDGVELLGYCTWSFTDLLSWLNGYQKRYGFVYVNREELDEKDLARYKKKSFYWYKKVIESNGDEL